MKKLNGFNDGLSPASGVGGEPERGITITNIGEAVEELVKSIQQILIRYSMDYSRGSYRGRQFIDIATEIAALMQTDKPQNASNKLVFSEQCVRDIIFDSFKKTATKNVNGVGIIGLSNLADFAVSLIDEFKKIKLMQLDNELLEALKALTDWVGGLTPDKIGEYPHPPYNRALTVIENYEKQSK